MKRYLTPIMIVAVCAIALGPLFSGFFGPDWRARWMLAWAANEYQNGDPANAEKALQKASEWSSGIATDTDFWKLKFDLVFNQQNPKSETIRTLVDESIALISKVPKGMQAKTATEVGQLFHLKKLHGPAVEVLETFYAPILERSPGENNELAYFRSLAKTKLETALKEIDAALIADGTSRKEFLDTKAWVLHALNRDQEAILFADEAIKRLRSEFEKYGVIPAEDRMEFTSWFFPDSEAKPTISEVQNSDSQNSDSLNSDPNAKIAYPPARDNRLDSFRERFPYINPIAIEALARQVAALRFHRACILDELGRNEESNVEYAWLDEFGYTNTNEIF